MASSRETKRREVGVSCVEIAAMCHATEECTRVEYSMKILLPEDLRFKVTPTVKQEKGYYGNPIVVMTIKVEDPVLASSIVKYVASRLDEGEKRILKATSGLRYDPSERRFTIRFSKQSLLQDKLQVVDADDVVKFTIYLKNIKKQREIHEFLKDTGLVA